MMHIRAESEGQGFSSPGLNHHFVRTGAAQCRGARARAATLSLRRRIAEQERPPGGVPLDRGRQILERVGVRLDIGINEDG